MKVRQKAPAQRRQHLARRLVRRAVRLRGQQGGDEVGVGRRAHRRRCAGRARRPRALSSAVLVRLPLWPSARLPPVSRVRKDGWAFSHVPEPVVE